MPTAILRLNFVQPNIDAKELSARYQAGLEMARFADQHGFMSVTQEEHHGADNGWSPSPLVTAGAILASTKNIMVSISALLVPLHDPLRIAEDIAVIDLMSGGRLIVIGGLGYRPSEYEAHGKDWAGRGKLMDECVAALLGAWTGEPFEYQGRTVKVTPAPLTKPHPTFFIGGTSKAAVRRAVRFNLPIFFAAPVPELKEYFDQLHAEQGTEGLAMVPESGFFHTFLAEDPDQAWAQYGHHLFHEASTYHSWQTSDIRSAVHSYATSPEELRAEGIYRILTPDEAIAMGKADPMVNFAFHPLIGGMPIDAAWQSLQLYADKVLPALT
jgi:alkanesulfonate monooxygenase SsuD/methylene tetrahydromethanopterin reductase-like flavin-dependent oxidoreductase (luciferase family)